MRRIDPLIAGGGPAGAAAAIVLARGGVRPVILERQRETGDALCGGFVSWRTLARLETLGVDSAVLGGHRVRKLRIVAGTRMAEAPLPGLAIGVSRRNLDRLLLDRATAEGAGVESGVTVRRIAAGQIETGDGATLAAGAIVAATGKHDVAGLGRMRGDDPALGLRVRLTAHPALAALIGDAIELHLFEGGYAGMVLQEDGSANLCLAVRKSRFARANSNAATLFAQIGSEIPALGERLGFGDAGTVDAIGAVPYGWIAREAPSGVLRVGDQAGCIPSLAGEGNGIAIASGISAGQTLLAGDPVTIPAFQPKLAGRLMRPIAVAKAIWQLCEHPAGGRTAAEIVRWLPWMAGTLARATRFAD